MPKQASESSTSSSSVGPSLSRKRQRRRGPHQRRSTCEACASRSVACSGTIPCDACTLANRASQCHYRGGLKLSGLGQTKRQRHHTPTPSASPSSSAASQSAKTALSGLAGDKDCSSSHLIDALLHAASLSSQDAALASFSSTTAAATTEPAAPSISLPPSPSWHEHVDKGQSPQQPENAPLYPFFRYFGKTAIAPGLRCVEVELKDEQTTLMHKYGGSETGLTSSMSPDSTSSISFVHASPVSYGDSASSPSNLFEASDPSLPSARVLRHLLPIFFNHMGCHLPFLSEMQIMTDVEGGNLEPLEANCFCALASRFVSTSKAASSKDESVSHYLAAEPFADMAKQLILPLFNVPSLKVCQALVMLTWIEWGSDRDASAWLWSGLAIRMSQDLGLSYADTLLAIQDEEIRRQHKLTFWAVLFLDRVISYGAGRRVTIADRDVEIDLPTSEECHASRVESRAQTHPWPYLIQLLRHRGAISDILNEREVTLEQSLELVNQGKHGMAQFFHQLPAGLRFNVTNLRCYSQSHLAPILVMIHCMFHSIICLLHRPSLLRSRDSPPVADTRTPTQPSPECSSSARSISDILAFSTLLDARTVTANPYMDHAIYIGSLALLEELQELQTMDPEAQLESSWQSGVLVDKFDTTREALRLLSKHWGGIRWVCEWLDNRSKHHPRLSSGAGHSKTDVRYKAAPAHVRLDMIKHLARTSRRNTSSALPRAADTGITLEMMMEWPLLETVLNDDNLVLDGVYNLPLDAPPFA